MCYGFEVILGTMLVWVVTIESLVLGGVLGAIFKGVLLSRGHYYSASTVAYQQANKINENNNVVIEQAKS